MATKATTALAVAGDVLSSADLTALLQQSGWSEVSFGDKPHRLKLSNGLLVTDDGEMFVYNPKKPDVPAMTVRIVKPPEEYWGMYISEQNARAFGDDSLGNTFSKSYVLSDPNRKVWPSDQAFEALKNAGLFDEYGKPLKPSWKADIIVQIMPDDGILKGTEPHYVLTLSTTSLIEFKGTSRDPEAGSVSEKNFIRKLSEFAIDSAGEGDQRKAVLDALTSLTLGGVAAEVRTLPAENKELGRTWTVISFDPIHIEPMQEGDVLIQSGTDEDDK